MQAARKAEEREAQEAGLAGKDAFAELKKLSRSDSSVHHNDPREDLERLYRQAFFSHFLSPFLKCSGCVQARASV